jgi:DNA (cytosine-5)-methyltransferase 1
MRFLPKIEAVDLFCGAGGLTCGLAKSSHIRVRCGIDIDPTCEFPYTKNNQCRFIRKRVEHITVEEISKFFLSDKPKLLAGCAPCQTFSNYYNPKNESTDSRWELLSEFARLVDGVKPEFVTMENVPGLRKHSVFDKFIKVLEKNRYYIWHNVIDCSFYGLPQRRKRLVLLASKLGKISLLSPEETDSVSVNVRDAIGPLERIVAGEASTFDPLHRSRNLTERNLVRIQHTQEGGGWRDWPQHLMLKCHQKECGKSFGSVYGRMKWNAPSPTITTEFYGLGNGRFGHPEQDRAISLREGAILQGFPADYQFVPPDKPLLFTTIGRLIGNAVPVRLGEVIGMSFGRHLKNIQQQSKQIRYDGKR